MSFKKLEDQDFIIDNSSVTSPMWEGNIPELTTYYTSSNQANSISGRSYLNVYASQPNTNPLPNEHTPQVQFSIAYCDKEGKGSEDYNVQVEGMSYSKTNYQQYKNLILGDSNEDFIFGGKSSSYFYAISIERASYKEKILVGSLELNLRKGSNTLTLIDNSKNVSDLKYTNAGRVFDLINPNDEDNLIESYGWLLPDIGVILIDGKSLDTDSAEGGIKLETFREPNINGQNALKLFNALKQSGDQGAGWTLNSEETISSNYVFIRARNNEFNFSKNPSYTVGTTGEVRHPEFIDNPQTYITTIGLYNDNNELLAVSKLSRPLKKDSTSEALIRIKLDF